MKTKIDENDPRLAAYAFGELSRAEADEVRRALVGRDDLQRVVGEFLVIGGMLSEGFGSEVSMKLRPEQRAAVHQSGKRPTADNVVSMRAATWKRPLVVLLGAAAAVAICFVVLKETRVEGLGGNDVVDVEGISDEDLLSRAVPSESDWNESEGVAEVPSSGGTGDAAMMARGMEEKSQEIRAEIARRVNEGVKQPKVMSAVEEERSWNLVSDGASVRVPLVAGNASWNWIKDAVGAGKLPEAGLVRVEEVLNTFDFELGDVVDLEGVGVVAKVLPCGWDGSKFLLALKVRNASEMEPVVELGMVFGDGVKAYRLVGYGSSKKSGVVPASVKLQKGYEHLVLYEFERSEVGGDVASVVVGVDGARTGGMRVEFTEGELEVRGDSEWVLLMATWCEWMRSGDEALKVRVEGMLRGIKERGVIVEDWVEMLSVVEAALKI